MAIQEPTQPDELFTSPFANNGNRTNIPLTTQTSGEVNWADGFGTRYNIDKKEGGLYITRQVFNQIFFMLSKKVLEFKNYLYTAFFKAENAIITNAEITSADITTTNAQNLTANTATITDLSVTNLTAENATINKGEILGGTITAQSVLVGDKNLSEMPILQTDSGATLIPTPLPSASGKELVNAEWVRNFIKENTPCLDYVERLTIPSGADGSLSVTLPTGDIQVADAVKDEFVFEIKCENGEIYQSNNALDMSAVEDKQFLALPTTKTPSVTYTGAKKTDESSTSWEFTMAFTTNETLKTNIYSITPFNFQADTKAYIKIYFKSSNPTPPQKVTITKPKRKVKRYIIGYKEFRPPYSLTPYPLKRPQYAPPGTKVGDRVAKSLNPPSFVTITEQTPYEWLDEDAGLLG